MKYVILIFVFCSSGCMNVDCVSMFSAGGMDFCLQYDSKRPVNTTIIEELVFITETEANNYYPNIIGFRNALDNFNVTVIVTPFYLVTRCHETVVKDTYACEEKITGINHNSNVIVMERPYFSGCFFASVLMHEILHTLDDVYLIGDEHSTPYLFMQNYSSDDDKMNTIEYKVEYEMIERMKLYDECTF